MRIVFWILGGVNLFFGCAALLAAELTILHTNDNHGHCWSQNGHGGLTKQMTVIESVRKKKENVLLLSAGDINHGVAASDLYNAYPIIDAMNRMAFDAMVPGNHEFSVPYELMLKQYGRMTFNLVCANVYEKKSGKRFFSPYIIMKIGDLRVAIVGLLTKDTETIGMQDTVKHFVFKDPIQEMKQLMPELKARADLVIAVTHMGWFPNGDHATESPGDYTLAKANPDIDIIVGGHTHTLLMTPQKVGRTLIVQAGDNARYIGEMTIVATPKDRITSVAYTIHTLDTTIPEDDEMVALLKPYWDKAERQLATVVAKTTVDLNGERNHVRSRETNLGNLVTDALRSEFQTDIAIHNGGGIRASIKRGDITSKDLLNVFPFGNTVVVKRLKGQTIIDMLQSTARRNLPSGGLLQVSGVTYTIKGRQAIDIQINGKPIDVDRVYTVAMSDFTGSGGDNYPMLANHPTQLTHQTLETVVKRYLSKQKSVTPLVEGRIRVIR